MDNKDLRRDVDDRDIREEYRDDTREEKKSGWGSWLLILVAFVVGWIANDALTGSPAEEVTQPGVGGGPAVEETASPTPNGDEEVIVLPEQSPTATP